MKSILILLFTSFLALPYAAAQDAQPAAEEKDALDEQITAEVEEFPEAPPEEPEERTGDAITFKSGAVLGGVQVLRRSPLVIEILIIPGVTLSVPRKQVVSIEYDQIEPLVRRPASVEPPEQKIGDVIPGDKLMPEVSSKLTSEIPGLPLKYDNQDLVTVLADLSQRVGVPIAVDDSVKKLPRRQRLWSLQAAPGTTLMTLLQKDFLTTFKGLRVVYQYDKLRIITKKKAEEEVPRSREAAPPPGPEGNAAK